MAASLEDYRVELDYYAGPLDLLLHLVKKHEIDLHDIPILSPFMPRRYYRIICIGSSNYHPMTQTMRSSAFPLSVASV